LVQNFNTGNRPFVLQKAKRPAPGGAIRVNRPIEKNRESCAGGATQPMVRTCVDKAPTRKSGHRFSAENAIN
jgi:hypothetical protein